MGEFVKGPAASQHGIDVDCFPKILTFQVHATVLLIS
jgi:hypothetical protein